VPLTQSDRERLEVRVADLITESGMNGQKVARRIVDCVNACAGIDSLQLTKMRADT
jgi:hypothetical protein